MRDLLFDPQFKGIVRSDSMVLPHREGEMGLKVNHNSPQYTWRDITGVIRPDPLGVNAPTLAAFRGGKVRAYAFAATDMADCEFHIPHDYVPGSDLFLHYHWSHNGTAISGNMAATASFTYSKGHAAGIFGAEKTTSFTYATTNIATTPRWVHRIEENQISTPGGDTNLLDSNEILVDGLILVNLEVTGIPTITGGSPNEPFILHVDLHYLSTNIGTPNKSPDFWV